MLYQIKTVREIMENAGFPDRVKGEEKYIRFECRIKMDEGVNRNDRI